jgi:ferredoxin
MEEAGTANLEKVDHVVVLMLENRSFDHMLGYLSLEGGRGDVDGLREGLANEHQGRRYPVHHLGTTVIAEDPDHSASSVDLQIGGGKVDGFVASYAATMESPGVENGDRWFSSVPGATWPNRLYALCGPAAGSRDCHPHNLPPLYNQPSFVRRLDAHGVSCRWYSSDIGTLRMADQLCCLGHHDRFAYFTKTGLPGKAKLNLRVQTEDASFLEDAARGTLPSVSWIDPNWGNFNPFGFEQNDDHPPADINDGQDLVLAVYHAVATSPQWDKTLLVIFYDECCLRCDVCIGCGLCMAACSAMGIDALRMAGTPAGRLAYFDFTRPAALCIGCGACTQVRPTGAIHREDRDGVRRTIITGTAVCEQPLLTCSECGAPTQTPRHRDFVRDRLPDHMTAHLDRELCPSCARQRADRPTISAIRRPR